MVGCVFIIITRGSTPLSLITFCFVVAVCISTSTFPLWVDELVSVYLDFLCLVSVRHEVNGKHRVLAAYIILTLEEAYRYNDRQ